MSNAFSAAVQKVKSYRGALAIYTLEQVIHHRGFFKEILELHKRRGLGERSPPEAETRCRLL